MVILSPLESSSVNINHQILLNNGSFLHKKRNTYFLYLNWVFYIQPTPQSLKKTYHVALQKWDVQRPKRQLSQSKGKLLTTTSSSIPSCTCTCCKKAVNLANLRLNHYDTFCLFLLCLLFFVPHAHQVGLPCLSFFLFRYPSVSMH